MILVLQRLQRIIQFQATDGFQGHFKMLCTGNDFKSTSTVGEKGTPKSRICSANDIAAILGIGRATAYKLANSGLFKSIRIGNMIRISRKSFVDWLKAEGLDDETD